jgi:hypothetical protein
MHFLLLLVISFPTWAATFEVPKEIRDPGSIKLEGTPGANQKEFYEICYLPKEKDNRFVKAGKTKCTTHKLGDEIFVPAGTYSVRYESTSTVADVQDKQVLLKVLPLELTKVDGTFTFSLYRDFENSDEQRKLLMLETFVGLFYTVWPDASYCDDVRMDDIGKSYCAKLKSLKDPSEFAQFWKFGPDGFVKVKSLYNTGKTVKVTDKDGDTYERDIYSVKFKDDTGNYFRVGSGKDGEFISVFPGVYSAYIRSAGHHSATQPNIVVK